MPKVYAVNRSSHDFSYALQYGSPLIYLTHGRIDKLKVNTMFRHISETMAESQPDDYIIQDGAAIPFALACSVFVAKHGRLNLLIFKAGRPGAISSYKQRNLLFDGVQR